MSSLDTTAPVNSASDRSLAGASPVTAVAVLLLLTALVALWTLAVGLSHSAPDRDGMEELIWAASLELGYVKHPPFPSWVMFLVTQVVGRPIWLTFLMGQVFSALALWFIWKLGCEFTSPARSLVAVLLLSTIAYFGMRGTIFNHNTAQLWSIAAATWLLHRALRHKDLKIWAALGLVCGLALLTKYSAVIQFTAFALFFLRQQHYKQPEAWKGVALAAAVCLATFSPHLYWLAQNNFAPLLYAESSMEVVSRWTAFKDLLSFVADQFVRLAPMVVALLWIRHECRKKESSRAPTWWSELSQWDRSFLLWVGLGPLVSTLVISLLLGSSLKASWATTFFVLFGFYTFKVLRGDDRLVLRSSLLTVAVLQLSIALVYGVARGPVAWYWGSDSRSTYPGKKVSALMQDIWQAHQPGRPLTLVASDMWLGGNISVHAGEDVAVFLDADFEQSPWLNPETALDCGALVAWSTEPRGHLSPQLEALYDRTEVRGQVSLPWSSSRSPDIQIHWGILAPTARCLAPHAAPGTPTGTEH